MKTKSLYLTPRIRPHKLNSQELLSGSNLSKSYQGQKDAFGDAKSCSSFFFDEDNE